MNHSNQNILKLDLIKNPDKNLLAFCLQCDYVLRSILDKYDPNLINMINAKTHCHNLERRWRRSRTHLDRSRTHADGFHYETYGEISPSRTLFYTLHCSLILLFQIDIRTRKCILHRWYGEMG